MRAIFDSSINFLDTSRIYGFGRSEERIGDVIRERGGLPPEASWSRPSSIAIPRQARFDAAQARRSVEESLKALGLDRIASPPSPRSRACGSLAEIDGAGGRPARVVQDQGGGSRRRRRARCRRVDVMMPLLRDWDFDALITHNRFTLVNRNAEAMIDFARSKGIAILNAAPYAGGVLAKGSEAYPRYVYQEASDEVLDPVRRIECDLRSFTRCRPAPLRCSSPCGTSGSPRPSAASAGLNVLRRRLNGRSGPFRRRFGRSCLSSVLDRRPRGDTPI